VLNKVVPYETSPPGRPLIIKQSEAENPTAGGVVLADTAKEIRL
jgi:co-chaperonin GroES (HSP10)